MCFERVFAFVLLCLPAFACSVLEDRDVCPCIFTLDMSGIDERCVEECEISHLLYDCGEKGCLPAEEIPPMLVAKVKKSEFEWFVQCVGAGWKISLPDSLFIPFGMECPPVYSGRGAPFTACEEARDSVVLHRSFTFLNISTTGFAGKRMRVTSTTCGCTLEGVPLEGGFEVSFIIPVSGEVKVAVPRQANDGLMLEIDIGDALTGNFAIGHYIAASGYDWSAEDLCDISLKVDYTSTSVSYGTEPWPETYFYHIIF